MGNGQPIVTVWDKCVHARLEPMLIYLNFISAQFSNAISSDVPRLIDCKFYVRHPGEGLYHSYGNYANATILSAERQGLWACCLYIQ